MEQQIIKQERTHKNFYVETQELVENHEYALGIDEYSRKITKALKNSLYSLFSL